MIKKCVPSFLICFLRGAREKKERKGQACKWNSNRNKQIEQWFKTGGERRRQWQYNKGKKRKTKMLKKSSKNAALSILILVFLKNVSWFFSAFKKKSKLRNTCANARERRKNNIHIFKRAKLWKRHFYSEKKKKVAQKEKKAGQPLKMFGRWMWM